MDLLDNWFQSIRGGNLKEAILIYKNNPDIINKFTTINDGRNHYQTNAIIEASFQGNRDLVKWLIDNNADVNSVSDGGWRPIHFAAQHGHVTTVNLLVLGGAEVNVKTETNETPIFLALQAYMRDTVKKLMYHGASLVGIDRNYLQMWIQKDVLDPSCLDEENKIYLADNNYNKTEMNGYDIMLRQTEREVEEIKIVKVTKGKLVTDYDNDLRRRRQDLVKKMRRVTEQQGTITQLIRKIALSDNDGERVEFTKEALLLFESQESLVPQTKTLDHLINLLELCICDSDSSEIFIRLASKLMMHILQHNARRGDSAVVDFWCRIFDKMSNLQIEQYTMKILEMLTYMIELANDTVINNFKNIRETFLKTWEYFFENLGFPKCLSTSLTILKLVHKLVPESVNHRFHNVIDIMIGWCIHPDTDIATLESIRARSADLHDCWISDVMNLKKTIANLQKDVISHCQILSRIQRLDKDRSQVDDLRMKIRYFCFALSCVTAGMSGMADASDLTKLLEHKVDQPLNNVMIIGIIEKLCESLVGCSKQIDFDNLLLQSNTAILHLLACLDKNEPLMNVFTTVLRYVFGTTLPLQSRTLTEGSSNINYNTKQLLTSNLDIIHFCCTQSILEPTMVIQIFSPVNWIHSCLFYGSSLNKELLKRLLRTVNIIIQSPVMTTFYQILLSDLELSINTLLKLSTCVKQVHLVQSNAFKNKIYDSEQAELVFKYNLNMILLLHRKVKDPELLVPSIPVLFQKYLTFYEPALIEKYPTIALFILESINSIDNEQESIHQRIEYNCNFMRVNNIDITCKKKVFGILKQILSGYDYNSDKKEKIINLVLKTLSNFAIFNESDNDIVLECVTIIQGLIRRYRSVVEPVIRGNVRDMAIKYTVHTSNDIRLGAFDIYYNLIDDNGTSDLLNDDIKTIQSISLRGRSFQFPLDFSKTIFNWIIQGCEQGSFENSETMRLYHLVVSSTGKSEPEFKNRMVILYEIIVNACWDCVRQKLKFDPNADSRVTLMTIENMVKCILTNGSYLKNIADKRFKKLMAKFLSKGALDQMLSVNLIALLLDVLEKMFYNSYEGCSVGLPAVNKTTENFFVTNKNVCSDWFIKMRLIIVAMAQYTGQWSTVIYHGMQLLSHHLGRDSEISECVSRALVPEMEDCIVFTSMALSKLGNWETLLGLSKMAVRIYGNKFDWIDALADKTIGHIESALEKFEEYVHNHHDPERMKQSPELRLLTRKPAGHSSFILCMEEIADCHRLLANVDDLERWSKQMMDWKSDSASMPEAQKSAINWKRMTCLAKLSKWDNDIILDDKSTSSLLQSEYTWKYRSVIDHCEDVLFSSAVAGNIDRVPQVERLSTQVASLQSICDFPMALANPEIILINERSKCLRLANQSMKVVVDTDTLTAFSPTLPLSVINFCNVLQKSYQTEECFTNQKYLIQWHRNLANFKKSEHLINQCFRTFLEAEMSKPASLSVSKSPIIQMELARESMKLLWATNHKKEALELLTGSLKEGLLFETSDVTVQSAKCHINTKSLLTLFQWLSNDKTTFSHCVDNSNISVNLHFLTELAEVPWINGLPLVSPQQRSSEKQCQSSVTDVCGQLLILASKAKNLEHNDKSFMTLAQWCLARSRSLDEAGFNSRNLDVISSILTTDHAAHIVNLFTSTFQPSRMHNEDDWLGPCYDDPVFIEDLTASMRSLCPSLPDDLVTQCLSLWKSYVTQHFSLHIAASDAYFSFLKDAKPQTTRDSVCIKNHTTANLRILSLLGKRSRVLRDCIIVKIKASPPSSWINVIPQLFARVKHPDNAISASVNDLLQRFALSDISGSKLIVYPTIVGTLNEDNGSQSSSLSSSCHDIRKVLFENNKSLVYEVEVFIKELRRITVLWDELWIASLSQCYDELTKKSSQLQSEIDRITRDEKQDHVNVILRLKYNSIIQPALFILERVKAATNVSPETPRESWFVDTFSEEINSTINAIKSPVNIYEFKDCWKKVKELQELMITESNDNSKIRTRRGRHQFLSLKLNEISPSLSTISKSKIPIPGMEDIELMSIDGHISILPTKTRPKKLQFVASNGKKYQYLYKGLEDLRLDERVMQILGMANTMFSKLNERESNEYHITTYSVTPLGPRAGLIQMVEDASSLFNLYKRHHIRAAKNSNDKIRYRNNVNEATVVSEETTAVRPTDIYWQKLRPKLEAAKLDPGFDSRDKWPSSILIDVLNELKRDTPADLLSRELWCCSINSQNWFRSSIKFTRSCAVMSMLGYCLGLGDRHLDNLLVNLSTGQMIHIDYNVCFDKGATLKVPEKVPFRLTDIITDVFGPMGVEGLYRRSCENVMDTVVQSEDNIMTMMDTFVLDPIVDWAAGIESGHYGSFEGGKFAVNSMRGVLEKRAVEFVIAVNNLQSVLVTMEHMMSESQRSLDRELSTLFENVEKNLEICTRISSLEDDKKKKKEMAEYLDRYDEECGIVDHVHYVKSIESRAANVNVDLSRRLKQMNTAISEHGHFFNMILSHSDYITFKFDLKNLRSTFDDNVVSIEKTMIGLTDEEYTPIFDRIKALSVDMEQLQECVVVFEKYRSVLMEMPESYYVSDRCSDMARITKDLIEDINEEKIEAKIEEYKNKWMKDVNEEDVNETRLERDHWVSLLAEHGRLMTETQARMPSHSNEEEIGQLEQIWQMTMYESVGINVFKSVLLDQYLEMATVASHIDSKITSMKIPDQVSLSVDYNDSIRKYLQLLNAHDNYFKILTNCLSVFGLYLNVTEASVVCSMLSSLHKLCLSLSSFETNYVDIIMPESIKIMRNICDNDQVDTVMRELDALLPDTDNILLHFNIALTSTSYDIDNYESIHTKTVVPIKESLSRLTDIKNLPKQSGSARQFTLLIASYYTTIQQTYQTVCDFIDLCIHSSTPSAWNYLDLVAHSGLSISGMWTKSHKLLKDAVYVTSVRSLISTLHQSRLIATTLRQSDLTQDTINNIFANSLRHTELYFNFISRHIIAGVGSQCFGKMFCLLVEFAGWNLDAMIDENVTSCAISADYICGSVATFRKTEYPNAVNFYAQLQFRFNNYKNLTGFNLEPNMSPRFLTRNLSFHKTVCALAKNQLVSLCWTRRGVLEVEDIILSDLIVVKELDGLLSGIGQRLDLARSVLTSLEVISHDLEEVDKRIEIDESEKKVGTETRNQILTSVRTKLTSLVSALVNLDRFECLRYASDRGHHFDEEIVQFFKETSQLLREWSECADVVNIIEEDIVQWKEERMCDMDKDKWWVTGREILKNDVCRIDMEHNEQVALLGDTMSLYEEQISHLATIVTSEYQPIISAMKPSLRTLYSITRKLRAYVTSGSEWTDITLASVKTRLSVVCTLMNVFERFNVTIESVTNNNCTSNQEKIPVILRLARDKINVVTMKDTIVPQLYGLLMSLCPMMESMIGDGSDVQSSMISGFSNNNMAESDGDQHLMMALSRGPLVPLMGDIDDCQHLSNNGGGGGGTMSNDDAMSEDTRKYVNNSGGIQRAVDVWRVVAGRVRDADKCVDKCIRAATSADNLARMYEGWTAWV